MATIQVTRPPRTQPQPFPKPALYEAISALNRDLGLVVEDLRRLREFRFSRLYVDAFIVKVEDLRAWAIAEFLEQQLDREMKDWFHFSQLDRKFENRYKDPNDVLIEARRLQEHRAAEEQDVLTEAERIRKQRATEKRRAGKKTGA
jgi:hypothetical protein